MNKKFMFVAKIASHHIYRVGVGGLFSMDRLSMEQGEECTWPLCWISNLLHLPHITKIVIKIIETRDAGDQKHRGAMLRKPL